MTNEFEITPAVVNKFLGSQTVKPGRIVIWNSYAQGTYIKVIHGPIGTPKRNK